MSGPGRPRVHIPGGARKHKWDTNTPGTDFPAPDARSPSSLQHLRLADSNKGRFRSFLLATLNFFLAREWSRAHRQKRGGKFQFVSWDEQLKEGHYPFEAADPGSPEKQFQRQWALTVLQQTMKSLEEECSQSGKGTLFREVKHLLSGERDAKGYSLIAHRLRMNETALRVAVHRLRHRYGELLRSEIEQTLEQNGDVEQELQDLMRALSE